MVEVVFMVGQGSTLALARWPDASFKAIGPPVLKFYWPGGLVVSIPYCPPSMFP